VLMTFTGRHLLTLAELSRDEIYEILERSQAMRGRLSDALFGRTLALIFRKPSTRTRVSFEVAMHQLGGHAIFLSAAESQLARGESIKDTARVMSRYVDVVAMRTYDQAEVEELARESRVPVINALTDMFHPMQVLADLRTVMDHKGRLEGLTYAYVGAGNNMSHTWIVAAAILGLDLRVASPQGFGPHPAVLRLPEVEAHPPTLLEDPREAVSGADVIVTDTWVSMGQEADEEARRRVFGAYQVNGRLASLAHPEHVFLHCMPAHVGEEVTEEVIYGPHSVVLDEAENRLHVQKAWLAAVLGKLA
jgi:ornithine carbamoyltransferase